MQPSVRARALTASCQARAMSTDPIIFDCGSAGLAALDLPRLLLCDDRPFDARAVEAQRDLRLVRARDAEPAAQRLAILHQMVDRRRTAAVGDERRLETAFDVLEQQHGQRPVRAVGSRRRDAEAPGVLRSNAGSRGA